MLNIELIIADNTKDNYKGIVKEFSNKYLKKN